MRDEDLALFIDSFGEATHRTPVPESILKQWDNVLPPVLLDYWKDEGWAGYANGLLWTVNPDDFEHIKDAWLQGTSLESFDKFHVIARSAFGNLYLCGERTGRCVSIICIHNEILALKNRLKPKTLTAQNVTIQSLFGSSEPNDFDYSDIHGRQLFDRAVKKYGPLEPDEMYGFEPALVLGGSSVLENLHRLKLDPHLLILRNFDTPTLPFSSVELEKLMK
ncbi:GAD-like domain protein [Pseudomonas taiwanensis]|uniref:GAD-like domain-containing protein n=1 Tax=Pseudomonas taiwanensis TaxID=470150 RepID=UPI0015BE2BD1|nr:GAD-like domain-containing protein [Pseudomonas taiwanensis]NWL79547.1 GAD-like domain protein [Pseudomonas taiwanensis]